MVDRNAYNIWNWNNLITAQRILQLDDTQQQTVNEYMPLPEKLSVTQTLEHMTFKIPEVPFLTMYGLVVALRPQTVIRSPLSPTASSCKCGESPTSSW